jgi:EAL domain-containing protein (putative c-di-GMP-specific phosphodiesterase class I)/FixJ family two-component response regulator
VLPSWFEDACVLVVDDHDANVLLLTRLLESAGVHHVHGITDSREVVGTCLELRPNILLLDWHMPHLDGDEVLAALQVSYPTDVFLPVLVLTADATPAARERALNAGAKDFVAKPFDRVEVVQRVRNLLETQALYQRVQRHNVELQAELERQADEQRKATADVDRRRARIERALEAGALEMVFQPIVDLSTSRIVGAEALARFSCEPRRPPDQWFNEANEVGLGYELEMAAVDAALASIELLPADAALSVNASGATAMNTGLAEALGRVASDRLVLELTEHTRIEDYQAFQRAVDELRHQGVRIAVDDAGAGYAGLQQILGLRPDIIKLDAVLTRGIDSDPVRRALAACLVSFGVDTGAVIVAEGIETAAELDTLRQLGVPWGQGYLLARPGPLPLTLVIPEAGEP